MPQEATYRICVQGELGPDWASWFEGLTVRRGIAGTTELSGVLDQAALHGLLAAIRDLGLSLESVETVADPHTASRKEHP